MKKFEGILPALIVPLTNEEKLNERGLKKHVDFLMESGVHGLYVGGSTGEGPIMPAEEREKVVEVVLSHVAGKNKTIMVHVGAVDTKTAIRLAKHAERHGADAIAAVPPFYYKVDGRALYLFYKQIADSVNIPLFIYNIPELTGVVIKSKDVEKLTEIDNIIGIKYSSIDLTEMSRIKEIRGGEFKVFFGADEILMSGLLLGADGGIGGTYNCMPGCYLEVYEAIRANDWNRASKAQHEIARFFDIILKYGNAISSIKAVLTVIHEMDMGGVISPLRDLTSEEKIPLLNELKEKGFFELVKSKRK